MPIAPRPLPRSFARALLASLWIAASFAAFPLTPAMAQPRTGFSATLATPLPAPRREIINGQVWRCEGDRCTAPDDGARPMIACQRVVETFGAVSAFNGPKGALPPEQLARCNAG